MYVTGLMFDAAVENMTQIWKPWVSWAILNFRTYFYSHFLQIPRWIKHTKPAWGGLPVLAGLRWFSCNQMTHLNRFGLICVFLLGYALLTTIILWSFEIMALIYLLVHKCNLKTFGLNIIYLHAREWYAGCTSIPPSLTFCSLTLQLPLATRRAFSWPFKCHLYSGWYLTPDKFGVLTVELVEKRSQYKIIQVFVGPLHWFMHHDITNIMQCSLLWHVHLHHQKRLNDRQIRLLYNEHAFHRMKYWIVHYQNNLHAYCMFHDTEISYSTVIQSVPCREGVFCFSLGCNSHPWRNHF